MGLCRLFILRPASPGRDNLLSHGCVWAGPAGKYPGRLAGLCNRGHVCPPLWTRHNSVDLSDLGPPYAMSEQGRWCQPHSHGCWLTTSSWQVTKSNMTSSLAVSFSQEISVTGRVKSQGKRLTLDERMWGKRKGLCRPS